MQFLADVYMKCSTCNGKRYRPEILKIKYRGRDIADVLELTVREAFTRYLGDGGRVAVPRVGLPVAEALALVRGAGGVAAWAHPSYDCSR